MVRGLRKIILKGQGKNRKFYFESEEIVILRLGCGGWGGGGGYSLIDRQTDMFVYLESYTINIDFNHITEN